MDNTGIIIKNPNQISKNKYFLPTLFTLIFIICHFILFPQVQIRSYIIFYLMIYAYFIESISKYKISEIKRHFKELIGLI